MRGGWGGEICIMDRHSAKLRSTRCKIHFSVAVRTIISEEGASALKGERDSTVKNLERR